MIDKIKEKHDFQVIKFDQLKTELALIVRKENFEQVMRIQN